MGWATFWAILSQTHLVTLPGTGPPDALFSTFAKNWHLQRRKGPPLFAGHNFFCAGPKICPNVENILTICAHIRSHLYPPNSFVLFRACFFCPNSWIEISIPPSYILRFNLLVLILSFRPSEINCVLTFKLSTSNEGC
jgi:hypothetical protein